MNQEPSPDYGIIVFSHLRWRFVWQRPQQFLSRFAETQPVLFVELTEFDLAEGEAPRLELTNPTPNITVANIHMPPSLIGKPEVDELMRQFTREAIDAVNQVGAFDDPLLWFYSPMDSGWALGHLSGRGVVYDCMDELSQFRGAPPDLINREKRLIDAADVVFTGGYELWLKKSTQHSNCHFFGCGVEYDHFARAQQDGPVPHDLASIPGPRVGWFGVVDERVDYDLIATAAAMRPDLSFVMVGPVVKVDPESLPQAPNLYWLGGKEYAELPDYCRGFDVCMMAFALNEATEFINPTKALEYLATGKPVIGTPVRDVVRQYSDTVRISKTPQEFIEAIEDALANPRDERVEKGIALAKDSSWEETVRCMKQIIEDAARPQAAALY